MNKKLLYWIGGVLTVIAILYIMGSSSAQESPTEIVDSESQGELAQNTSSSTVPIATTTNYKIIYTDTNARYDGGVVYYVLIDPVNLNNATFKEDVKAIIRKMVVEKGRKISVDVFDNRAAMDVLYKQYGDNSLGRPRNEAENKLLERHYIAGFSGQLATDVYDDELSFFLNAFKSTPEVGKYVETVEFKP